MTSRSNALDEAIKLNPNYGGAFANRAGIYLKKNEYDRAARDYDEAIRLEPNLEAVWSGRCWTRAILGELQTGAGGLQQGAPVGTEQCRDV